MPRHAAAVRKFKHQGPTSAGEEAPASRASLYAEITDRIIRQLEAGCVPWAQPWGRVGGAGLGLPTNAATGRTYSGINVLLLWGAVIERGYPGQAWLTFRRALTLGGSVRKGERGTTVVYADRFTPEDERERARRDGDEARGIHFLKRFTVFNTEQCEGLPDDVGSMPTLLPENLILPQVEELIRASGADLRIGGDRACYDIRADLIRVPPPQAFHVAVDWHRTALHELGHWSGAEKRLGRDLSGSFCSKSYAQEELVAEMTAAFTCASLSIEPTVRHADYIGSWLEVLRQDDRAIVRAASAASKAADFLLAFRPDAAPEAQDQEVAPMNVPCPSVHGPADRSDEPRIARALATSGGHLAIGRGGYTLHYDRGCRMSGYDVETIKAACIAAGLPVIDSREAPFEAVAKLAVGGLMVAVGEEPDAPPWNALAFVPLRVVADAYREAGAEVFNI